MTRYLPGIILVQFVTLALFLVNRDGTAMDLLVRVGLPALLLSGVTALWFSAISRMQMHKELARVQEQHFNEREKLTQQLERERAHVVQKASADQAKLMEKASSDREKLVEKASSERERLVEKASSEREKLVRQVQKDMLKTERRASRSANLKVGAAFTLVTVAGVGLLFVQFMTLGLLTITGASGALGGYLLRWRQTRHVTQLARDPKLVETVSEQALLSDETQADKIGKRPL